jgi:hypothetical protein
MSGGHASISSDGSDGSDEDESPSNSQAREDSAGVYDDVPHVPPSASVYQCISGLRNIFRTAVEHEDEIVNRARLLYMFDERTEARERLLLHDINILTVMDAVMAACAEDDALLFKLNRRTLSGAILPHKRLAGTPPSSGPGLGEAPAKRARERGAAPVVAITLEESD